MEGAPLAHEPLARETAGRAETRFGRLIVTIGLMGGLVALATALMVTASVVSRYLGFGGISGDFDLVQVGIALAVFAFMPITQWRRSNIVVDTFSIRWPPALVRAVDAFWDLVLAVVMGAIAYAMAGGARDALNNGLASMVLSLPLAPVFIAGAALLGLLSVTAAVTALRRLAGTA